MLFRSDGGCFVFTVEALPVDDEAPHRLRATGRYAHARSHLEAALHAAGFAGIECASVTLRQEAGLPVEGWLVSASIANTPARHPPAAATSR